MNTEIDVIDAGAGLAPGGPLHAARRLRPVALQGTQASHDALLFDAVPGLSPADRLRVAAACCDAVQADELAAHYRALLEVPARRAEPPSPALPAMLHWALLITTAPRDGDRAAVHALRGAGLADPAIVALAQLVGFLSYQTRVVAGLKALAAAGASQ